MHIDSMSSGITPCVIVGLVVVVAFVLWLGFCLVIALRRTDEAPDIIMAAGRGFPLSRQPRLSSGPGRGGDAGPDILVPGAGPAQSDGLGR